MSSLDKTILDSEETLSDKLKLFQKEFTEYLLLNYRSSVIKVS